MITIFAVPFAGGYKYSYQQLEKEEMSYFKLLVLELPGRGLRTEEPLLLSVEDMADDILRQIKNFNTGPFALMGHSLGALICWQVARKMFLSGEQLPINLFLSGCPSPSTPLRVTNRHELPRNEFLISIESMDEMPGDILKNEELMDYFEPILRADFTALEKFKYTGALRIPVQITLINGTHDCEITLFSLEGWNKETLFPVSSYYLEGAHFYLLEKQAEFISVLSAGLRNGANGLNSQTAFAPENNKIHK
jgi:surfactin synthase thioesterase subunit